MQGDLEHGIRMKSVGLVSWKGGTGKTILACNIVERAMAAGLRVTLCDFDPQATALRHCELRLMHSPDAKPIEAVQGSLTLEGIEALRVETESEHWDLLVCDMPGADSFTMDRALAAMDLLLIPVTAAPYEVMVTGSFVSRAIQNGWNIALLLNNLPPGQKRRDQLVASLSDLGVELVPAGLVRRVSYWDAALVGMGVCEFAPRSLAASEMQELWDWLRWKLGLPVG